MGRTMTYCLEQRKFKNNQALDPIYMVLTKIKECIFSIKDAALKGFGESKILPKNSHTKKHRPITISISIKFVVSGLGFGVSGFGF